MVILVRAAFSVSVAPDASRVLRLRLRVMIERAGGAEALDGIVLRARAERVIDWAEAEEEEAFNKAEGKTRRFLPKLRAPSPSGLKYSIE